MFEAEFVRRRYDDCFTRPGLIVVAAALALEEGGDAEPLLFPLLAEPPLLRPYEDCFTRPGAAAAPVPVDEPLVTAGAGSGPPARGSTPPARGGCAVFLDAQDGAAVSPERGDLELDLDGDVPDLAPLPVPDRGEESAALRDEDTPGPLFGDDGDGTLAVFAAAVAAALDGDRGGDAVAVAPGEESGKLREAAAAVGFDTPNGGFTDSDAAGAFVFSARAAARKATRDGDDGLAVAARVEEAAVVAGGEPGLAAEAPLDGELFPAAAAARAEARVVAGRAEGILAGLGSTRSVAAAALGDGGAAAAGAARVPRDVVPAPPDRAFASVSVISPACDVGLRLGASAVRSASPGMRPPRSVAFASALADVSNHEISFVAPAYHTAAV